MRERFGERGRLWIVGSADIAPPIVGIPFVVDNCTRRANHNKVGRVALASSPFGQMARENRRISYGGPCWLVFILVGSR